MKRSISLFFTSIILSTSAYASRSLDIKLLSTVNRSGPTDSTVCIKSNRSSYRSTASSILKKYVEVKPKKFRTIKWNYNLLCFNGLEPGVDYNFTMHKGMPLGSYILDSDYTFSAKSPDYEPHIKFKDDGYIVAKSSDITIPIESVNVKLLNVVLYRVNERNLINTINEYGLIKRPDWYDLESINDTMGQKIWSKKLSVNMDKKNEIKNVAIPIGSVLKNSKPGVYLITAKVDGDKNSKYNVETQWFIISDIGIFTIRDSKGLHVWTRHFKDSKLYSGLKLQLISASNEILSTKSTKDGYVLFEDSLLKGKKGMSPRAVYAFGNGDFNALNLSAPSLDLTDRGIDGRVTTGDMDALLFSNRDIFKPGSNIRVEALVRDNLGDAKANMHFLFEVRDSKSAVVFKKVVDTDKFGSISVDFNSSKLSATGRWSASLLYGDNLIGKFNFLVEDFVPSKIKAKFDGVLSTVKPGDKVNFKVLASYLNNIPLKGANVEVSYLLKASENVFKDYKGYIFGEVDDKFKYVSLDNLKVKSNENGVAVFSKSMDKNIYTNKPMELIYRVSVDELGGRPLRVKAKSLYLNRDSYIGIKPMFEDDAISLGNKANFKVIYLRNQKAIDKKLTYTIKEEISHWHWRSQDNGDWSYYKTYTLGETLYTGEVEANVNGGTLTLKDLDWGDYRIEINDENSTISSYRFSSGYGGGKSKTSPDKLPTSIDKKEYKVGSKLKVSIKPKFKGPIEIFIATDKILEKRRVYSNGKDRVEVEFNVKENWGAGAYVLTTAFREHKQKLGATRAIGVAYAKVSKEDKILNISLKHKKSIKSKSKVEIEISSKSKESKDAVVVVSAVDEGILTLTKYDIKDPVKYFFSKQMLSLEIKDLYSNIIKSGGEHAEFKVGAGDDGAVANNDSVSPNKRAIVALFSKRVKFKDGTAKVSFDIPDYQGALKITAVAWSKDRVGYGSSELIVKDDFSLEYYMPAFMAVDDRASTLFSLVVDSKVKDGKYRVELKSSGGIKLDKNSFILDVNSTSREFKKSIGMNATDSIDGKVVATIYDGDKVLVSREWSIGVREKYPLVTTKVISLLKGKESIDLKSYLDKDKFNNLSNATLKLDNKPLLGKDAHIYDLVDYYGRCTEQTTSRAFGVINEKGYNYLVNNAINRLMHYQHMSGAFSLWDGAEDDVWLSAFVVDFLLDAKKKGYSVDQKRVAKTLDWIENNLNRWTIYQKKQEADIFGLYVLTKSGRVLRSELEYRAKHNEDLSSKAWGELAMSFYLIGDKKESNRLFDKALKSLVDGSYYRNYGGKVRDHAALILLLKKANRDEWEDEVIQLAKNISKRRYFSTQEDSYIAQVAIIIDTLDISKEIKAKLNGEFIKAKSSYKKKLDLNKEATIENLASKPVWMEFLFRARVGKKYFETQANKGFSISKKIFTLDGKEASFDSLVQGEKYVVVISGKRENYSIKNPFIVDYIPAGLEIINPDLLSDNPVNSLDWVKNISGSLHTEYRNDRFTDAVVFEKDDFKSVYMVTAVTKGDFAYTPVKIEDMYKPDFRAFSDFSVDRVKIVDKSKVVNTVETNSIKADVKSKYIASEKDFENVFTKKVLSKDLKKYTILDLNILRNSIFAKAGLDFNSSNVSLYKRFKKYTWYKPVTSSGAEIYSMLSNLQKENVQTILNEEKSRAGGLTLADFYRVHAKALDQDFLKRYTKEQLKILKYSVYVRNGLKISDDNLLKIYKDMPWYKEGTANSTEDIVNLKMSKIESSNIQNIKELER